ncbi:hypothetical protein [Janthinobacterium sp. 17J80-10]|uniref:hypothetical protein n=1 Tax=Janthinobacterium sp. 17J80-10 TaxID=2497863 RepID=UPI00100570BB|nr:hypothetical protein [Janthinobacterium sp. 17J80-10]QAU32758.1 hypothetical protein EKL02_00445 [Janthinobacterium sp. 17J80-10]
MSPWIIPALKAILPHVGDIVSATKPIFTRAKGGDVGVASNAPVQQQIAELQAVAAQNDAHIRELAEQLQTTVTAIEEAALAAEAKSQRLVRICVLSMGISVVAAGLSLILLFNR